MTERTGSILDSEILDSFGSQKSHYVFKMCGAEKVILVGDLLKIQKTFTKITDASINVQLARTIGTGN